MPVDESAQRPPVAKPRTPRLDIVLRWLIGICILLAAFMLLAAEGARGWDGLAYLIGAIAAGALGGLLLVLHLATMIIRGLPARQRRTTLITLGIVGPLLLLLAGGYHTQKSRIGERLPEEQHGEAFRLAGATFPEGGTVQYMRSGLFSTQAIAIRASAPGHLGHLRLTELELSYPPGEGQIAVTLAAPQTISGWHCDSASPVTLVMDGKWQLGECVLARNHRVGALDWPAGTQFSRNANGMRLYWSEGEADDPSAPCRHPISTLGYRFSELEYQADPGDDSTGTYSGTLCDAVTAGPSTFQAGARYTLYGSGSSAIWGQPEPAAPEYETVCVEKGRPEEPFRKCGTPAGQDTH